MFDLQLATFVVLAAALTVSPGADTLLVIRNVVARGRGAGIATAFGICCGLFVHATLSALGLSVLLAHSAWAYELVKVLGALYLIWLGLQSLVQTLRRSTTDATAAMTAATPSSRSLLLRGSGDKRAKPEGCRVLSGVPAPIYRCARTPCLLDQCCLRACMPVWALHGSWHWQPRWIARGQ